MTARGRRGGRRRMLSLLLLLQLATPVTAAEPAVVTSLAELRERPAIEIGPGLRVRLGWESTVVPVHGAVLAYALLEADAAQTLTLQRCDGIDLGPLAIRDPAAQVIACMLEQLAIPAGEYLVVASVGVPAAERVPGRSFIHTVEAPDKSVIDTVEFTVGEPIQPWLRLVDPDLVAEGPQELCALTEAGALPEIPLAPCAAVAWPRIGDHLQAVPASGRLPTALPPDSATLGMTAVVLDPGAEATAIAIASESAAFTSGIGRSLAASGQWVARWWRDGEPLSAPAAAALLPALRGVERLPFAGLEPAPSREALILLEAALPADHAWELQLLWCRDGVTEADVQASDAMLAAGEVRAAAPAWILGPRLPLP